MYIYNTCLHLTYAWIYLVLTSLDKNDKIGRFFFFLQACERNSLQSRLEMGGVRGSLVSQQGRQDPPDAPHWTSMFWYEKRGKGTRFVGDGGGVRQWAFKAHLSYCSLLTWCSWMQLSVTNATIDKTTGKVSLYASSWSSSCALPLPMGSACPTRCSNLVMAACTQKIRRTFKQHIDTSMNKRSHIQLRTEDKIQHEPCTWTHYSLFSYSILGLRSTTLPGSRCCHRCHRSDASH